MKLALNRIRCWYRGYHANEKSSEFMLIGAEPHRIWECEECGALHVYMDRRDA